MILGELVDTLLTEIFFKSQNNNSTTEFSLFYYIYFIIFAGFIAPVIEFRGILLTGLHDCGFKFSKSLFDFISSLCNPLLA